MGAHHTKNKERSAAAMRIENADPRSPTTEITRTPSQGNNSLNKIPTKNNPILTAVIKSHMQSFDPRSPSQDFERTPIIISSKENRHQNNDTETLQVPSDIDVSTKYIVCTPTRDVSKSPEFMTPTRVLMMNNTFDISMNETCNDEELLGWMNPEACKEDQYFIAENNMKFSKMLETNFDFMESALSPEEGGSNNIQEDVKASEYFKILDKDPRSPSVGIERTPIVVTQMEDSSSIMSVENMSDDSLINVIKNTNVKLCNAPSKSNRGDSDGLLIYEDDSNSLNDNPHKPKSEGRYLRKPLACMQNKMGAAYERSKSTTNLNKSNTERANLSKIPIRSGQYQRVPLACMQNKTRIPYKRSKSTTDLNKSNTDLNKSTSDLNKSTSDLNKSNAGCAKSKIPRLRRQNACENASPHSHREK